jgi:molybdopterin converting factor small subunit
MHALSRRPTEKKTTTTTLKDLERYLIERYPKLSVMLPNCLFSVNLDMMDLPRDTNEEDTSGVLSPGDEIALIPPVSGG